MDEIRRDAVSRGLSPRFLQHLDETRERVISTVDLLEKHGLTGKNICELGPGGVGLACREHLKANVEGYDCSEWSREMCTAFDIPWRFVDLHQPGFRLGGPYDAILMCEVIEHVARWPADVISDARAALKPGGLMLVTTQNLHRLSQRIRMVAGRRLFAHYVPEDLVMAHLREYTPEELVYLFQRAGFDRPETQLLAFPDSKSPTYVQGAYSLLCRAFPRLSNIVYCWALK